ncbi:MAG: hypothetical protein AABX01_00835 [Candidatus Micrarchaeota archaeon]
MNALTEINSALALCFFDGKYAFIAFLSFLLMAFFYAAIPVLTIPGNALDFFVSITPWWGFLLIFLLAALMGVLVAMQYYVIKNTKSTDKKEVGSGFAAFFSSILSGIFATASCAACISVLFSFLGAAGIFFLLDHRWEITVFGFLMVGISIYLTARRINNHCEECKVSR